jgi:hypothetical protein
MMALNYRVAKLDARQRAMLDYTWKMTTTPYLIGDADRDALRAVGLSTEDIFDLSETVAFFNLSNRMASATDMMPNKEYHPSFRSAAPVAARPEAPAQLAPAKAVPAKTAPAKTAKPKAAPAKKAAKPARAKAR